MCPSAATSLRLGRFAPRARQRRNALALMPAQGVRFGIKTSKPELAVEPRSFASIIANAKLGVCWSNRRSTALHLFGLRALSSLGRAQKRPPLRCCAS
jgi:hypothetical protein